LAAINSRLAAFLLLRHVPQDAEHLGRLAGDIHPRHRILENTGSAVQEMHLALEEMLLDTRRITCAKILPQLLALGRMKECRQVQAFQRDWIGVEQGGESGVDLDDGAGPVGQKHWLARGFPNGAELDLRLQQFLVGAMPV
jgi:hypothetical protein